MAIRIIEFATGFQTDETPGSTVAASTISVTPSGDLSATTVQAALVELQGDIDAAEAVASALATTVAGKADAADLSAHITDPTAAHAASAVANTPSGNLSATDVQAALNELQTDVDTRATSAALTTHTTDTANPHAVTKAQVGLSNVDNTSDATKNAATATLTNKIYEGGTASATSQLRVPKAGTAVLTALGRQQGALYFNTDLGKLVSDNGSSLDTVGSGTGSGQGEKNYITNSSMQIDATGWNNVGDLDVTRTTTAAELPREYTTAAGIKITADSNTQSTADYVYFDFTLDDVDLNRKLVIKWSQKQTGSYATGNLAVVITSQADRTTALYTPQTTAIPAADGDFQTTFDAGSTATLSLVIRATTDMATDAGIVISDVVVGPGVIGQVPPVGNPTSVTFTGTWVANTTYTAFETRIGSWAKYEVKVALTGAPTTATLVLTMPSGRTINTDALANASFQRASCLPNSVVGIFDSGTASYVGNVSLASTTTLDVGYLDDLGVAVSANAVTQAAPITFANGDFITLSFMVPIYEWAGSVSTGPAPAEEYAYPTGTLDSSTTASSSGTLGMQLGTLSTTRTKDINWQYPLQVGDRIEVLGSTDRVNWVPIHSARLGASNVPVLNSLSAAGGYLSGIWWQNTSATVTRLVFAQYANAANDDSPTQDWPSDAYLLVRKVKAASLPFANATESTSGLIPAYGTGTWTPAESSKTNLTGTGSFGTATYTRIGNMVFARIELITGYSITSSATNTALIITTTGLPGITNATPFYGSVTTSTGSTYVVACISDNSGGNTNFQVNWVSNGTGSVTIGYLSFTYTV